MNAQAVRLALSLPRFSRAVSHPAGKCIAECKTVLPESVDDELVMLARLSGQTKSEYVRDLLTEHVLGRGYMVRLSIRRPNGMAGQGLVEGLKAG